MFISLQLADSSERPERLPNSVIRHGQVQYLYCHPGPDCKLIQAKYFGKVRDDIEIAECGVGQLKVKVNENDSTRS